jgi:hypothetical protein
MSEYGRRTTAKAKAALRAEACLSGEKRMKDANAD